MTTEPFSAATLSVGLILATAVTTTAPADPFSGVAYTIMAAVAGAVTALAPHVAVLADVLPRLKGVALGLAPALIPMPQPPETE